MVRDSLIHKSSASCNVSLWYFVINTVYSYNISEVECCWTRVLRSGSRFMISPVSAKMTLIYGGIAYSRDVIALVSAVRANCYFYGDKIHLRIPIIRQINMWIVYLILYATFAVWSKSDRPKTFLVFSKYFGTSLLRRWYYCLICKVFLCCLFALWGIGGDIMVRKWPRSKLMNVKTATATGLVSLAVFLWLPFKHRIELSGETFWVGSLLR